MTVPWWENVEFPQISPEYEKFPSTAGRTGRNFLQVWVLALVQALVLAYVPVFLLYQSFFGNGGLRQIVSDLRFQRVKQQTDKQTLSATDVEVLST